ncbi:MAG: hypothetical protein K2X01_05240 [Cyanobacteria bacterium]|nr:hypothetical protein [Cyanobacteriota bacterium]
MIPIRPNTHFRQTHFSSLTFDDAALRKHLTPERIQAMRLALLGELGRIQALETRYGVDLTFTATSGETNEIKNAILFDDGHTSERHMMSPWSLLQVSIPEKSGIHFAAPEPNINRPTGSLSPQIFIRWALGQIETTLKQRLASPKECERLIPGTAYLGELSANKIIIETHHPFAILGPAQVSNSPSSPNTQFQSEEARIAQLAILPESITPKRYQDHWELHVDDTVPVTLQTKLKNALGPTIQIEKAVNRGSNWGCPIVIKTYTQEALNIVRAQLWQELVANRVDCSEKMLAIASKIKKTAASGSAMLGRNGFANIDGGVSENLSSVGASVQEQIIAGLHELPTRLVEFERGADCWRATLAKDSIPLTTASKLIRAFPQGDIIAYASPHQKEGRVTRFIITTQEAFHALAEVLNSHYAELVKHKDTFGKSVKIPRSQYLLLQN